MNAIKTWKYGFIVGIVFASSFLSGCIVYHPYGHGGYHRGGYHNHGGHHSERVIRRH